jgi:predicted transcriptional regulator
MLFLEDLHICGYVLYNDADNFRMDVYPIIFERQFYNQPFIAYLIQDLVFAAICDGTREIYVYISSQSKEFVEPVLNFMGFLQAKDGATKWHKRLVKKIVTFSNFSMISRDIIMPSLSEHQKIFSGNKPSDSKASLPTDAVETSKVVEFSYGDESRQYSVSDLEHIFYPMLFRLQSRSAVLIPIKPIYANELIPGKQEPFLFNPEYGKLLRFDNVYFSGSNALNLVKEGSPIVFYSSSPERKAIATAKIIEATVDTPDVIDRKYQNLGSFNLQEIKAIARRGTGRVMAIRFHWTMPFKNLIPLPQLRQIYKKKGCKFTAPQGPMMMPFDVYWEILKITGVF